MVIKLLNPTPKVHTITDYQELIHEVKGVFHEVIYDALLPDLYQFEVPQRNANCDTHSVPEEDPERVREIQLYDVRNGEANDVAHALHPHHLLGVIFVLVVDQVLEKLCMNYILPGVFFDFL